MDVKLEKYKCDECGFMYDNRIGDDSVGIVKGTLFKDLPEQWKCPMCGASKELFYKI